MNWREEPYKDTFFHQVLYRDDGKALGAIMRFYSEEAPTYALVFHPECRRLGPCSTDQAARTAVEEAVAK